MKVGLALSILIGVFGLIGFGLYKLYCFDSVALMKTLGLVTLIVICLISSLWALDTLVKLRFFGLKKSKVMTGNDARFFINGKELPKVDDYKVES